MRGAEAYRQTEARSRSPLELVVMLYEGALRFIGEAREADGTQQLARRATAISKTLAIIGELQSTLDVANGGQVAADLDRLYVLHPGTPARRHGEERPVGAPGSPEAAVDALRRVVGHRQSSCGRGAGTVNISKLEPLVTEYRAGLEAEMQILRRLDVLAAEQRDITRAGQLGRLSPIVDERDRLVAALVAIEHGLKPMRLQLAEARAQLGRLLQFREVIALHRQAEALATAILTADSHSAEALKDAEIARHAAAQALARGESTLAAYRRVITPDRASPALVNRRG